MCAGSSERASVFLLMLTFPFCVVRPAFSDSDMEARYWLKKRFEDAHLDTTIDGVGNVLGRSRKIGTSILLGSHSDTQPEGGWLDGALGVIYGLEVARALHEYDNTSQLSVDVVSWQDEESNFLSCLGSRSWCGTLNSDLEKLAVSREGEKLVPECVPKSGQTNFWD